MTPEERAALRFDSKTVYYPEDGATQSIAAPLVMSSSFQYDAEIYQRVVDGERKDVNIYGRCGNPTEYQFEEQMMQIENADACLATASGMAAISFVLFGLLISRFQYQRYRQKWSLYQSQLVDDQASRE